MKLGNQFAAKLDSLIKQFSEEEEREKEVKEEKKVEKKEDKKTEMNEEEKREKEEKDFSERFNRNFSESSKEINDRMVALEEGYLKVLDMCEKKLGKK